MGREGMHEACVIDYVVADFIFCLLVSGNHFSRMG